MQLVIVHYHLNRGGVTQVVLNHLHALAALPEDKQPSEVLILGSGQRTGWPGDPWQGGKPPQFKIVLADVPSLEYDSTIAQCDPAALAEAIGRATSEAGFDPSQTVLHVHNHSLGKNASLPGALRLLSQQGYRLLLQVHDFAEDFRPANYRHLTRATKAQDPESLAGTLYPAAAGIHYAVLNGRDHGLLDAAGVDGNRLHSLPNPVVPLNERPPREKARERVLSKLGQPADSRLVVYPVRGIRRKNVGEVLLHSALAGEESCYAITLAPANPIEVPPHIRWQELAEELSLNCRFDIGGAVGVDFLDALVAADALITTSVAEGFGMVFLEAWLAGAVLVGRDLPEITADFRSAGLKFDCLSSELLVPTDWIDAKLLASDVHELHRWTCQDYGLPDLASGEPRLVAGGAIDFAALPASYQRDVIRHVAANRDDARTALFELNPGLRTQLEAKSDDYRTTIDSNADRVRGAYSPEAIGQRLFEVYSELMAAKPEATSGSLPNGRSILDYFLTLDRLRPVRLET